MQTTTKLTIDTPGIREITVPTGGMSSGIQVFTAGRNAKGRLAGWDALRVTVTARGHWYRGDDERDGFSNDTLQ